MIRPATIADAQAIARVHVDAWCESYQNIVPQTYLTNLVSTLDERTQKWQTRLSTPGPDDGVFVVECGNLVVGYCRCGIERKGDPQFSGELYQLYLLQQCQGRELGSALFKTAVDHLHCRGHTSMVVWTFVEGSAKRFYERMGGTIVRENMDELGGVQIPEIAYGWYSLGEFGS